MFNIIVLLLDIIHSNFPYVTFWHVRTQNAKKKTDPRPPWKKTSETRTPFNWKVSTGLGFSICREKTNKLWYFWELFKTFFNSHRFLNKRNIKKQFQGHQKKNYVDIVTFLVSEDTVFFEKGPKQQYETMAPRKSGMLRLMKMLLIVAGSKETATLR